jgi:sec-independent protein translocase protein TatA
LTASRLKIKKEGVMNIGGLGTTELVIVLLIVVVLFGGSRVGKILRETGTGLRELRKALREGEEENENNDGTRYE